MADAPSPYAPGIIADERLPPRPAGRASVFLVATFAMTVATSGLYRFWSGRAPLMTGHSSSIAAAMALVSLPGMLALLWAYLSDRVGLLGTRREGYLLLASMMMVIVWLGLAFGSQNYLVWIVTALPTGLAAAITRAAIVGALAEIGQRRSATGGLAAAYAGLSVLAEMAVLPATYFLSGSITWTSGVMVGLMLALALMIAVLWDSDAPAHPPASPWAAPVTIPGFLRSRAFWGSVAVLILAGVATVPDYLMARLESTEEYRAYWQASQWKTPAITIGIAGAYLLLCRRIRFDLLLRFALFAKAIALAVHALVAHASWLELPFSVLLIRALGNGLTMIALIDLTLRAAPRGREAFGAVLLAGLPGVITLAAGAVEFTALDSGVGSVAWFGAGAAVAATLAVSLLPREIGHAREGRRAPESPMVGSPP